MGAITQGLIEGMPVPLQRGAGVDIAGRTVFGDDVGHGELFGIEPILSIFKMVHES